MYEYIRTLLGVSDGINSYNSNIIYIAGFLLVMTFVICADNILNGLFKLFNFTERRK